MARSGPPTLWQCRLREAQAARRKVANLSAMTMRPLESDVERLCASIRVALEKRGTPIGAHDMLIAAHARAIDAVCHG